MNASAHRSHAKNRSIDDLNARIKKCTGCRLSATRKHPISGEGDPDTRIMLVALSPGAVEDAEGGMFLGPSGKILDNLFQSAGIEREQIYMTNLVKCMLPKNREPKWDEIEACSRFLEEEISILQPEFIVPLGYYATRKILTDCHADPPPERKSFSGLYGKLIFSGQQKIFPLPHPATLIYSPSFENEMKKKYRKLQILLHDCKWFPVCPMKSFY